MSIIRGMHLVSVHFKGFSEAAFPWVFCAKDELNFERKQKVGRRRRSERREEFPFSPLPSTPMAQRIKRQHAEKHTETLATKTTDFLRR